MLGVVGHFILVLCQARRAQRGAPGLESPICPNCFCFCLPHCFFSRRHSCLGSLQSVLVELQTFVFGFPARFVFHVLVRVFRMSIINNKLRGKLTVESTQTNCGIDTYEWICLNPSWSYLRTPFRRRRCKRLCIPCLVGFAPKISHVMSRRCIVVATFRCTAHSGACFLRNYVCSLDTYQPGSQILHRVAFIRCQN